jgi:2-oxoglutarate ferredoxin oxidoreductase subunit delta
MAKVQGEIVVDAEICKGCELCIIACPEETLGLSEKINQKGYRYAVQLKDNCTGCANCGIICPDAAITVYRVVMKTK